MKPLAFARENGWLVFFQRAVGSILRRFRDAAIARKLGTQGFHCGRMPRLLGLSHIRIGKDFNTGDNLWLEAVTHYAGAAFSPLITIGDGVGASDNVHIACINSVSIGSGTLIGSRVIISDHAHGIYRGDNQSPPDSAPVQRPLSSAAPVVVGKNVWIGDGVAVLAGAEIGDGCIIGANSVVTGKIPAATIAVGTPARPVRRWNVARAQWVACDDPR